MTLRELEAEVLETFLHLEAARPDLRPVIGKAYARALVNANQRLLRQAALLEPMVRRSNAELAAGKPVTAFPGGHERDLAVVQLDREIADIWRRLLEEFAELAVEQEPVAAEEEF